MVAVISQDRSTIYLHSVSIIGVCENSKCTGRSHGKITRRFYCEIIQVARGGSTRECVT